MLGRSFLISGFIGVAISMAVSSIAEAYYVRPGVQLGGGAFIDGYSENGPTQASQGFGSNASASVDLATGTTKNFLEVGAGAGLNVSGQSFGGFGETLTFNNAAGTNINFNFGFDGTIVSTGGQTPGLNSFLQMFVFANLYVYAPGVADYTNFNTLGSELGKDTAVINITNPQSAVNQIINDSLSVNLLGDGTDTFDVFVSLAVAASTNNNQVVVTMDFTNTGTFGLGLEDGVTFTSQSGVFLNGPGSDPVPEPSALGLIGLGVLGMGVAARRRRQS